MTNDAHMRYDDPPLRGFGRAAILSLCWCASCSPFRSFADRGASENRSVPQHLERGASELEQDAAQAPPAPAGASLWQEIALRAPIHAPRPSFFNAALGVPAMETAAVPPCGTFGLRLRTTHARSNSEETMFGFKQDFDGLYHEYLNAEIVWSPFDDLEIAGAATFAGWDEHLDRFSLFDENGQTIIHGENAVAGTGASSRHTNLSRFDVRGKWRLVAADPAGWDFTLAPALKIPFGREHDLTHAGTFDGSLTLLATFPMGAWTLHANLGGTIPWGDERIFTTAADVELDPFLHGGLSAVVPLGGGFAGIAQLEANTSAFRDVPQLEDAPVNVLLGLRSTGASTSWDLAIGTSLDWDAGYQFLFYLGVSLQL